MPEWPRLFYGNTEGKYLGIKVPSGFSGEPGLFCLTPVWLSRLPFEGGRTAPNTPGSTRGNGGRKCRKEFKFGAIWTTQALR